MVYNVRLVFFVAAAMSFTYMYLKLQGCNVDGAGTGQPNMLTDVILANNGGGGANLRSNSTTSREGKSELQKKGQTTVLRPGKEVKVEPPKPYKRWVYHLKGSPHYQKNTKALDSGFDCVRTKNITHMCEMFIRVTKLPRERQIKDSKIDWKTLWAVKTFQNVHTFTDKFNTCVVLGSSALTKRNIYDYSKYFLESDVVFAVNSKRPWIDIPPTVKVLETFDLDHTKQSRFEFERSRINIITSWKHLENFTPAKNIKIALPSTPAIITNVAEVLGIKDPGFTSGIYMVLWAKFHCTNVKVIGFYGFSQYEYGPTSYTPDKTDHFTTEKTGQLHAMIMLLRLHELKQIELVL